jgi:PKD repeat protein
VTGRRLHAIPALALAILASASGVARADNSGQQVVAVVDANGGQQTYAATVATLNAGCPTVPQITIDQHGPGGEPLAPQPVDNAWPVSTLIDQCLGIPSALAAEVTDVLVEAPSGLPQTGPGAQLTPLDWQPSATQFPIVASDGTNLDYYREWRGGADANATDDVVIAAPASLTLEVYTAGTYLPVTVDAPATAATGTPVTLSASVPGASAGATYQWSFDGGSGTATVANPTVTFAAPGTYTVTLQVSEPGAGGAGSATIVVGGGVPTGTTTGPATGPAASTGTTPQAPPARRRPRHRARTHARRRVAKRRAAAAPSAATRPAPPHHATATVPAASTPTATAPALRTPTVPAPAPRAPTVTASTPSRAPTAPTTEPTRSPARRVVPRPVRRRTRSARAHPRSALSSTSASRKAALVEGRLIASVDLRPVAAGTLVRVGSDATAPAARGAGGDSPLAALAAALGVVLLFALGAARESGARLRSTP